MGNKAPLRWEIEQKKALVNEFLQEYLETKCYTTTFARKQGINDSTFLGWVRQFDTEHIYPSGKQGRSVSNEGRGALVLVGTQRSKVGRPHAQLSIDYEGCTIHLDSDCSIDELSKVLAAIKGVGR